MLRIYRTYLSRCRKPLRDPRGVSSRCTLLRGQYHLPHLNLGTRSFAISCANCESLGCPKREVSFVWVVVQLSRSSLFTRAILMHSAMPVFEIIRSENSRTVRLVREFVQFSIYSGIAIILSRHSVVHLVPTPYRLTSVNKVNTLSLTRSERILEKGDAARTDEGCAISNRFSKKRFFTREESIV